MSERRTASLEDIEAAREKLRKALFDGINSHDITVIAKMLFQEARAGGVTALREWRRALPVFANKLGVTPEELVRQFENSAEAPAPEPAKKGRKKKP